MRARARSSSRPAPRAACACATCPAFPIQGSLPLVGRVAAGSPILAAEHIEAQYRIDAALFTPRADYLLRVKGASMQDAGILDGDLLVVHKTDDARSGQIVVARLGEEVTVKRLKRRGREITLMAENAAFAPIVVDPAKTVVRDRGRGGGRDPSRAVRCKPYLARMATIRYLVHDVDAALDFYVGRLGFTLTQRWGPPFAMVALRRSHAVALRAGHVGVAADARRRAARARADGTASCSRCPTSMRRIEALRAAGVRMRSDVVSGPGGRQILIEDPSGNPSTVAEI